MSVVHEAIDQTAAGAIRLRRTLHQHPELGWTEYVATWTLLQALQEIGIEDVTWGGDLYGEVERMGLPSPETDALASAEASGAGVPATALERMAGGRTGLVAVLDSGVPGPTVALRADIDALPVAESSAETHRPAAEGFRSRRPGISHACGHDAHTATVYQVAAAMRSLGQPARGKVLLVFQPAEEGVRGARALVDAGWLDGVDRFLSLHNASREWFTAGAVSEGVHDILATVKVDVTFTGREAHAALAPELGRSALLAASAVATLTPALPRRRDRQTITAVGELHAGTNRNVVPAGAELRAEVRSTAQEEVDEVFARFERLVHGIGDALEVGTAIRVVGRSDAASSDRELMARVGTAIDASPGLRRVPSMEFGASDDAAVMMRHVQEAGGQASYLHVGNDHPGATHTPDFDVNEQTIGYGAEVLLRTVLDLLGAEPPSRILSS